MSSNNNNNNNGNIHTTNGCGPGKKNVFLSTGRLPWYKPDGSTVSPYMIAISGGSASGKTTVSQRIIKNLGVPWVALVSMDSFYKCLTDEQKEKARRNEFNFDHPNSFDTDLLFETLSNLKQGIKVDIPTYDFKTHSRLPTTKTIYGANVIIFEGIFALYDPQVRSLMDLMIFVDTDSDIRLARRLKRDISERGRDLQGVLDQYNKFVKPAFDEFIGPSMRFADIVVPRGSDNKVAIDLITTHIHRQLDERGLTFRGNLVDIDPNVLKQVPENVVVLKETKELKAIHTIIRDRTTSRSDFIFFTSRLSRLVVEQSLSLLPFSPVTVPTPTKLTYKGLQRNLKLCSVSIIRSGGTMEAALRQVIKDITIGKILIQTDPKTGEPTLHYCKLPDDIVQRRVFLADATIATGAAATMAIRILLEHGVPEENITFLSLLCAPQGLHTICKAFPKMTVVTAAIDEGLDEHLWIKPGMGNFGDRWFGN